VRIKAKAVLVYHIILRKRGGFITTIVQDLHTRSHFKWKNSFAQKFNLIIGNLPSTIYTTAYGDNFRLWLCFWQTKLTSMFWCCALLNAKNSNYELSRFIFHYESSAFKYLINVPNTERFCCLTLILPMFVLWQHLPFQFIVKVKQ